MGIRAALALSLAWLGGSMDAATGGEPAAGPRAGDEGRITMPGSPFGVAWGFLYGYPGTKAEVFLPQLRQLGAGCTKLYLTWSQIEPKKGGFDWQAVDTFLGQLQSPDEALIAVWSSSTWATRRASPLLLSSPAKDPDDYYRFVHALVTRCKGRVRYWQNDCEPNNPIYWSGTAQEFVAQLKVFRRAVKDADPEAVVVCGGYDGLFRPPGQPPIPGQERGLAFFDTVLKNGADAFDLFDLRLYADPYSIPARVATMRTKMTGLGYQKPIICTEYNGPGFFEFPVNRQYVGLVTQWAGAITGGAMERGTDPADATKNPIAALYAKRDTLAPQTQMFLAGCPKDLEEKFHRIACRDLVMRNLLALSSGVQKTMYWDLWHDTSKRDDLMHLMYARFRLLDYDGGVLKKRYPSADAFRRMTEALAGVEAVRRVEVPGRPATYLFEVSRRKWEPVFVVWERRDVFSGEDQPAVTFEWAWDTPAAKAFDALGQDVHARVTDGRLSLSVSATPIFIAPTK